MEKVQTGFRVPETLNEDIEQTAKAFEITKNALMTMAVRIGLNELKTLNRIPVPEE